MPADEFLRRQEDISALRAARRQAISNHGGLENHLAVIQARRGLPPFAMPGYGKVSVEHKAKRKINSIWE